MKFFTEAVPTPFFLQEEPASTIMRASSPEAADVLILPFKYEVIHDFTDAELEKEGISKPLLADYKLLANRFDEWSVQYHKPLIVTFYRDPLLALPFRHAWVFRTSSKASFHRNREWGMPAFVDHFASNETFVLQEKSATPSVTFRGEAAPLSRRNSITFKEYTNAVFRKLGSSQPFTLFYNEGYLARRDAMRAILKKGRQIQTDFEVNMPRKHPHEHKAAYLKSFQINNYVICAAGHGNYSYRLYETMREGRIPVYIDTDAVLPCQDLIDWHSLVVWIDQKDISRTGEALLDFHHSIHPDDFIQRQLTIREVWKKYLTETGFRHYLFHLFLPSQFEKQRT